MPIVSSFFHHDPMFAAALIVAAVASILLVYRQIKNVALKKQNELLQRVQQALHLRDRALDACPDGVVITGPKQDYSIIYVNPAFEKITGYTTKEILGKNCRFLQNNDHDQIGLEKLRLLLHESKPGQVVLRNYRKDGSLFWNEMHLAPVLDDKKNVTHYVGVLIDVTERVLLEEQLTHHATHDTLTNLPNRILLLDRIQHAIVQAKRNNLFIGVVFLDIDRFKFINDSLGHRIGDTLLQEVAVRLSENVRGSDTVARLGGDEFVIILAELSSVDDILPIIKKCREALNKPLRIEEHQLNLTTSIGISVYPQDGDDPDLLIKHADIAMYWAKQVGWNNFQFYLPQMHLQVKERLEFESELRHAIERDELLLYYQPIIDLITKKIIAVEALLRWQHPRLGFVAPDNFIPVAEEMGLMPRFGEWVLRQACLQHATWLQAGLTPINMAVNISDEQLKQPGFFELVKKILQETKLDPKYLELELTENIIMKDFVELNIHFQELKQMGVHWVIDDFGVGYSNLTALKELSVQKIKIDRAFIRHILLEHHGTSIVSAIISLAKNLNVKVIAEGIETEEQLTFLRSHHCDAGQGYYFSQPLTADACAAFIKKS